GYHAGSDLQCVRATTSRGRSERRWSPSGYRYVWLVFRGSIRQRKVVSARPTSVYSIVVAWCALSYRQSPVSLFRASNGRVFSALSPGAFKLVAIKCVDY